MAHQVVIEQVLEAVKEETGEVSGRISVNLMLDPDNLADPMAEVSVDRMSMNAADLINLSKLFALAAIKLQSISRILDEPQADAA